jgi:bifunctional DNase/RNase
MDKIEMVISSHNFPLIGSKKAIILKEKYGNRTFIIWVNPFDAEAISAGIKNLQSTKLHTFDFVCSIITGLGSILEYVIIDDTNSEDLRAAAIIRMKNDSIQIRCTPSDAVSIALKAKIPIFVAEDLLKMERFYAINKSSCIIFRQAPLIG